MSGLDAIEFDDLGSRMSVVWAEAVDLLGSSSMTGNGSPMRNGHRERWN